MLSNYEALKLKRENGVLTITIDNPPVNQMSFAIHDELSRIFDDVNRDDETNVVVLTGAGKVFCGGGNLNVMLDRLERDDRDSWFKATHEAERIIYGLLRLEKPLIGRINGHAMGLGSTLAVFCDVSFMVEDAKIADNHVGVGLAAGDGGALMWPLLMGFNKAKEYLFTGDVLTGKQAAELGIINHAVPREELDERVDALVQRLATGATRAIRATKKAVHLVLRAQLESLVETHLALETETQMSADHREAAFAFRDKRTPQFKGK